MNIDGRNLGHNETSSRKALISPGFGAGWSTWIGSKREHKVFALFDEPLIAAVERGDDLGSDDDPTTPLGDFVRRFEEAFPEEAGGVYTGGARDLQVWEIEGQFIVEEYDGSESIRVRETEDWF